MGQKKWGVLVGNTKEIFFFFFFLVEYDLVECDLVEYAYLMGLEANGVGEEKN